jgi:hypothetical protein
MLAFTQVKNHHLETKYNLMPTFPNIPSMLWKLEMDISFIKFTQKVAHQVEQSLIVFR